MDYFCGMHSDTRHIDNIVEKLMQRIKSQMPKIIEQVDKYEAALASGTTVKNPKPSPQFNG